MSPVLNLSAQQLEQNGSPTHFKKSADGFGTRAIHVGSAANEETGAVIPPISLSTTYKQASIGVHKVSSVESSFDEIVLNIFPGLRILALRKSQPKCFRVDACVSRVGRCLCPYFCVGVIDYGHHVTGAWPQCPHRQC